MNDSSLGGHKGQAWQSLIDLVDPKGLDLVDPKGLPWFCTEEFENRMCSCTELSNIAQGVHVHVCMHDHVHVHMCMHVHVHVCMCTCAHVLMHCCNCVCVHVCMCTCANVLLQWCQWCLCAWACAYTHHACVHVLLCCCACACCMCICISKSFAPFTHMCNHTHEKGILKQETCSAALPCSADI